MDFILASKNKHKLAELSRILSPLGVNIKLESDLGITLPEVDETGTSFEENAELKARSACEASGLPAIADDSGMCVDGLDGAPGVYSARYAGEHGNDDANNKKLLNALEGLEPKDRGAAYVSVVCCVYPDGRKLMARGECRGTIGYEEIGDGGFGYDPLFMVGDRSLAEMTAQEKDAISHRGNALKELQKILPAL
mgnify:CR=1 FL=1